MESSSNDNALDGWTKDEKFVLLQGIKARGSYDVKAIQSSIPAKTVQQVTNAIKYYKKKALRHPSVHEWRRKEKLKVNNIPRIPLVSWATFLSDSLSFKDLHTETATALRLIAEFEALPASLCTGDIDFKQIYHQMANAMEGKELQGDVPLSTVLDRCIIETALTSKAFMRNSCLKNVVNAVNMSEKEMNTFPKPTGNNELAALRHLASQRTYNPLNVAEAFLKPIIHT